jgi:hypothetical protein
MLVCHREEAQAKEQPQKKAQMADLERLEAQLKAGIVCKEAELAALSKEAADRDRLVEELTLLQEEVENQMLMAKNEKKWAELGKEAAVEGRRAEELKLEALRMDYDKVRTRQEGGRLDEGWAP